MEEVCCLFVFVCLDKALAGLEFLMILPLPPECSDYRPAPPSPLESEPWSGCSMGTSSSGVLSVCSAVNERHETGNYEGLFPKCAA